MKLNVDCGERELGDTVDRALLQHAHIANIALGGHAGSPSIAKELANQATACGVELCLHPGYPDRDNFGREPLTMPWMKLESSLDRQRNVLPDVDLVKFHGALYHASNQNIQLANHLTDWMHKRHIRSVITIANGELARACKRKGLQLIREGFADRRYVIRDGLLQLKPRSEPDAVLNDLDEVIEQTQKLCCGEIADEHGKLHRLDVDTLCIHGDGEYAVDLARAVREVMASC